MIPFSVAVGLIVLLAVVFAFIGGGGKMEPTRPFRNPPPGTPPPSRLRPCPEDARRATIAQASYWP